MGRVTSHSEVSFKSAGFTSLSPEFFKLGSTKGCQGFHKTKCVMAEEGFFFFILNLYAPGFVFLR